MATGKKSDLARVRHVRILSSDEEYRRAPEGDIKDRFLAVFAHSAVQERFDALVGQHGRGRIGPTELVGLHPDGKQLFPVLPIKFTEVWNADGLNAGAGGGNVSVDGLAELLGGRQKHTYANRWAGAICVALIVVHVGAAGILNDESGCFIHAVRGLDNL
jgi:hypothetical protein